MHDFTVWASYGKWRKNWDIRYCLLHLIHLSPTRLRRCGRILSGICEPYCLITPDLTMRYCPILILIDYKRLFDYLVSYRDATFDTKGKKCRHHFHPLTRGRLKMFSDGLLICVGIIFSMNRGFRAAAILLRSVRPVLLRPVLPVFSKCSGL